MTEKNTEILLHVSINSEGTSAQLTIPAAFDRSLLSIDLIQGTLSDQKINLSPEVKEKCVKAMEEAIANLNTEISQVVATAKKPVHGSAGQIEWVIDRATKEQHQEDLESGKEISHYDRSAYIMVEAFETVGILSEPGAGEDGVDVRGNALPAKSGTTVNITHDESITINSTGAIITQEKGVLVRKGNNVCVRQIIEVANDVDFNTGNIKFNGDVTVHKSIKDCFTVEALGNVIVHGQIGAATVIAGKNLMANSGFIGRERGLAIVGQNLEARFIDGINAEVEGNLNISKEIINCKTIIHQDIDSPSATIIGGNHFVTGSVSVKAIGSPSESETHITLGTVTKLQPITEKIQSQVDIYDKKLKKIQKTHDKLTNCPAPTAAEQEKLCEVMFDLDEYTTLKNRAQPVLDALNARIDSKRKIELEVHSLIYAGVVIHAMGHFYRLKREITGPFKIIYKTDMLFIQREQSDPEPIKPYCEISKEGLYLPDFSVTKPTDEEIEAMAAGAEGTQTKAA